MEKPLPTGFENALSSYQAIAYDSYCGEPIAWGYKIIQYLGLERFDELRRIANLEYFGEWCVVVRTLTREDATGNTVKLLQKNLGQKVVGDQQRLVTKYLLVNIFVPKKKNNSSLP